MSDASFTHLPDRGVVAIEGTDAVKFLNGLVTNEVSQLAAGEAAHAALLSPQGKILFDFLAVRTDVGFVLDVPADKVADLVKRLSMYKLRSAVTVIDASAQSTVGAVWGTTDKPTVADHSLMYRDPRHELLGWRLITSSRRPDAQTNTASAPPYHAHRIAIGVPEGGKDYDYGDAYPHEADFDLFNGVSFKKGCYVGQEVVSRMQHKTVVRKRVVRASGTGDLQPGADVTYNGVAIGRIGSVDGRNALAMMRLDRYAEALQTGATVEAAGVHVTAHKDDIERYLTSAARHSS